MTNMRGHVFSSQAIQETANIFSPDMYRMTGYLPSVKSTLTTIDTPEGVRTYIENLADSLTNGNVPNNKDMVGILGKNFAFSRDDRIVWNATYSHQVAMALVSYEIEYLANKNHMPVSNVIAQINESHKSRTRTVHKPPPTKSSKAYRALNPKMSQLTVTAQNKFRVEVGRPASGSGKTKPMSLLIR